MNYFKTVLVFLFTCMTVCSFAGEKTNGEITVFKETEDQWKKVQSLEFNNKECASLQLEYDSYYTIQISGPEALKSIAAVLGNNKDKNKFTVPFESMKSKQSSGMESYFTELPFALVSYTQHNTNDKTTFTVLLKTKAKETIIK